MRTNTKTTTTSKPINGDERPLTITVDGDTARRIREIARGIQHPKTQALCLIKAGIAAHEEAEKDSVVHVSQRIGHFAGIATVTALDDAAEIMAEVSKADDVEDALLAIMRRGDVAAALLAMAESLERPNA